jgi:hypothetical protein
MALSQIVATVFFLTVDSYAHKAIEGFCLILPLHLTALTQTHPRPTVFSKKHVFLLFLFHHHHNPPFIFKMSSITSKNVSSHTIQFNTGSAFGLTQFSVLFLQSVRMTHSQAPVQRPVDSTMRRRRHTHAVGQPKRVSETETTPLQKVTASTLGGIIVAFASETHGSAPCPL